MALNCTADLPCRFQNLDRVPFCKHSYNLCQTRHASLDMSRSQYARIEKKSGQIISIAGNSVQLMDLESYETFETPMPDDEELKRLMAPNAEVEYWEVLGKKMIVRKKG